MTRVTMIKMIKVCAGCGVPWRTRRVRLGGALVKAIEGKGFPDCFCAWMEMRLWTAVRW